MSKVGNTDNHNSQTCFEEQEKKLSANPKPEENTTHFPEFKLEFEDETGYSTYILTEEAYVVGRAPSCSIGIPDPFVSSQHAILTRVCSQSSQSGFTYRLQDGSSVGKSSTNGVYVNGKKIQACDLKEGDIVAFGPSAKACFSEVLNIFECPQMDQLVGRLDRQLKKRTYLLKAAFSFEKKLKKIVGKVRDSLDENQILKTAVDELAIGLGIKCCNASLFDFEKRTSTIFYEYSTLEMATRRIAWMEDFPELYQHLIRGQHFQFCSLLPHPIRGRVAMLACPIIDEQGVLGDLWLVNHPNYTFTDRDISLVRQVAYQCATAVRQARLFREVQTKLEQLEELNRLKDDFLSTVSHELRSPITNLRMALTMLATSLDLEEVVSKSYDPQSVSENSTARYLRISYEECQRERKLIEDLLELQQFEFSARPLQTELISLQDWLPRLTVPFQMRARKRQQNFHLDIASNLPAIASEASSLERILTELLNNACKYTPPHGDITLAASSTLGDEILLSAINSGAEIPAEAIPKLFDKFYRVPDTDRWKQGGTGLGLALVKRLAEHLGGTIQVMSLDGETRFTLRLPSRLRKNMLTQPQTNDLLTQELRVI